MTGFKVMAALLVVLGAERASSWNTLGRDELNDSAPLGASAALVDVPVQSGSSSTEVKETSKDDAVAYLDVAESVVLWSKEPSGPNACAAVDMGADKSSALVKVENISSADICQLLCTGCENCKAAVYIESQNTCDLLKDLSGIGRERNSVLIAPICATECLEKGKRIGGTDGIFLGFAPNPNICQLMCQANNNCGGFTWEKDSDYCMAFPAHSNLVDDANTVSGRKESCSTNEKQSDYAGVCYRFYASTNTNHLDAHENVSTYDECAKRCRGKKDCNWVSYNHHDKTCWYYPFYAGLSLNRKHGSSTGPKYCSSSCYMRDIQLIGNPIGTSIQENPQFCHYQCYSNKLCTNWSYNTDTQTCFIYEGSSTVPRAKLTVDFWSGTKDPCRADAS